MRIVFIGAGELTIKTATRLIERGCDVVIIEKDAGRIEQIGDELDCGLLHGDGGKPAILAEAGPEQTDVLFCVTDNDRDNILASLIGKSLGFKRVVTKIEDSELSNICNELGLDDTIIPSDTISRYLADLVEGTDILELSTIIKGPARFFMFEVGNEDGGTAIGKLELPDEARVICLYRGDELHLADDQLKLRSGDEVVILTRQQHLKELRERWRPREGNNEETEEQEQEQDGS